MGRVVFFDFGAATRLQEQIYAGERRLIPASDIYAPGIDG